MAKSAKIESSWTIPLTAIFERLDTAPTGLSETEAKQRLQLYGPNRLRPSKRTDALTLLAAQFKSPLIIILLVAVVLSFFFNESIDALIIIAIILLSSLLGFWQEKRAADAVKSLLSIVKMEATVLRDGVEIALPVEDVVPGDVCLLATAFQLACYALFVSYALRLTAWGMVYVAGAVVVGMLLDEVPKTLRKKPVIIEVFKLEDYQAGSWAD